MTVEQLSHTTADPFVEWGIPCETRWHERYGFEGDAVWIAWRNVCCQRKPFCVLCDQCLKYGMNLDTIFCRGCGSLFTPGRTWFKRVEAL